MDQMVRICTYGQLRLPIEINIGEKYLKDQITSNYKSVMHKGFRLMEITMEVTDKMFISGAAHRIIKTSSGESLKINQLIVT